MVQIGTIEYKAQVTNVGEATDDANEFAQSQTEVAQASEESAAATGFLAGVLQTTSEAEDKAGDEAQEAKTSFDLMASAAYWAAGSLSKMALSALGVSGAVGTLVGALGTAKTVLSGLTLSGVVGSVTSAMSGFVSWLAAGSAGALAFGAGIGAIIGLFGVWALEVTGVLDKVQKLGAWLGNRLPNWARDGLQSLIFFFTGPLAAIGAFIVGTIRGGFDKGFAMARKVIGIQLGAVRRTFGRFNRFVYNKANAAGRVLGNAFADAKRRIMGILDGIMRKIDQVVGKIQGIPGKTANAASNVRVGGMGFTRGGTGGAATEGAVGFKGFPIDVPWLDKGGIIKETGAAVVHKGEAVVPKDAVQSGGGGTSVTVDQIKIDMSGEFDPSDMSRRDLESLADDLVDLIGKKANRKAGFR